MATTLTSWALLIWMTLRELGYDPRPVFAQAGLDATKLGDQQARFDASKMYELWQAAVEVSGEETLGVRVGAKWSATTFNAIGFAWLASSSLNQALTGLIRYGHIVNDSLQLSMRERGALTEFSVIGYAEGVRVHPCGHDAALCALVKMVRLLMGENFCPVLAAVQRPADASGALEAYLRTPIEYSADSDKLVLETACLRQSLPTGNDWLRQTNEHLAEHYLAWMEKADLVSRVKAKITELLPSGTAAETEVARQLHVAERTLRRKLQERNTTFNEILKSVRRQLALQHMEDSQLSLTEIAFLLGYSDQAAFNRAFRRWFQCSPTQFRADSRQTRQLIN